MNSLVFTFAVGLLGLTCLAFGFLYKQDSTEYSTKKWYQVLGYDLPVRITFWVLAAVFLGWAGWFQFSTRFL